MLFPWRETKWNEGLFNEPFFNDWLHQYFYSGWLSDDLSMSMYCMGGEL